LRQTFFETQCSSGPQSNFAAFNRGRHMYSARRPTRWELAHILVIFLKRSSLFLFIRQRSRRLGDYGQLAVTVRQRSDAAARWRHRSSQPLWYTLFASHHSLRDPSVTLLCHLLPHTKRRKARISYNAAINVGTVRLFPG